MGEIRFNPVVSAGSILLILLFVTTSIAWRQDSPFTKVVSNVPFEEVMHTPLQKVCPTSSGGALLKRTGGIIYLSFVSFDRPRLEYHPISLGCISDQSTVGHSS